MIDRRRARTCRLGAGALTSVALAGVAAALLACGPFLTDLLTVQPTRPADRDAYTAGRIGIVRPRFAREHLVEAYRRFSGLPPLRKTAPAAVADSRLAIDEWFKLAEAVLHRQIPKVPMYQWRKIRDYQWIENCHDGAFANARDTLKARTVRFGQSSPDVEAWTLAQVAVFRNCNEDALVLPEPAPSSADSAILADRAYQTAAAYFYATRYEEAGQRFRAIAADGSSPWRKYGRYLAGRSNIRMSTVMLEDAAQAAQRLTAAEADLKAVLDDAAAAGLHDSARGLLDFIAVRFRPVDRLHAASRTLTTSETRSDQALVDFQRLMDRFVGHSAEYPYASINSRPELTKGDDLVDWILAMQGTGDEGLAHAIARWKETHATPWLVAAMWKLPPAHPDAAALMTAAEAVGRSAPAFDTVSFLRVRLLIAQGRRDGARRLLGTLPTSTSSGALPETVNLLKAQRFLLARTLEELLTNAPRIIVTDAASSTTYGVRPRARSAKDAPGMLAFDNDAAIVLSSRLPLERLVEAAASPALPDRLRARVASAAFTRAVVLHRDAAGLAVAPHLRSLSPHLASNLDRYVTAPDADARHRAGVLLLLRTPGMHLAVQGLDDNVSYEVREPASEFNRIFRRNWWCGADADAGADARFGASAASATTALMHEGKDVPFPEFLDPSQRAAAREELKRLSALADGTDYLSSEAIAWARGRPDDIDAAEALAHAVEGGRWNCKYLRNPQLSRRAFQTLHRLFPQSQWAKQTKFWYR